jgi:two-component system nitrogen regulation response regulator GlnG
VRVVAATHQDLETLVEQGKFRADLLHRLDMVRLWLPPLRERGEDVPQLAETFLANAARRLEMPVKRLSAPAITALRGYAWPGNVRELENVCWRLAALAAADTVSAEDVQAALARGGRGPRHPAVAVPEHWDRALAVWAQQRLAEGASGLHAEARARLDAVLLEVALTFTDGHRGDAATRLGLGRNTITRKLGPGRFGES